MLLAVFIYWGWESAVNLSEETEDSARAPGLAGLTSTVILLVTYLGVAIALVAYAGLAKIERFDDNPGVLGAVAEDVLGPLAFLVVVAIIVSGISSAQTTILPGSRTSLSMAVSGALPKAFSHIHPRFLTPDFGTIFVGVAAIVWYVAASVVSDNFVFDSLSALALLIAFYYGLTGIACAIYYRRELLKSAKNFIFIGLAPVIGALMLFYLLVESIRQTSDPDASYSGDSIFGLGLPLVIAIFFFGLGVIVMVARRLGSSDAKAYFQRSGFEAVPPEVATGDAGPIEGVTSPDEEKSNEHSCRRRRRVQLRALRRSTRQRTSRRELGDGIVIVFGYDPGSIEAPEGATDHRDAVRKLRRAGHRRGDGVRGGEVESKPSSS